MNDTAMKTNVARVFIVQDNPQHSYWPAEKHGVLRHCLTTRADAVVERAITLLRRNLAEFEADRDFLCISGSPIMTGVAMAILHERFDVINALKWSSQMQEYEPVRIDFMIDWYEDGTDAQ